MKIHVPGLVATSPGKMSQAQNFASACTPLLGASLNNNLVEAAATTLHAAWTHPADAAAASAVAMDYAAAIARTQTTSATFGHDIDFDSIIHALCAATNFGAAMPPSPPPGLDTPPKTPRTLRFIDNSSSPWHPATNLGSTWVV